MEAFLFSYQCQHDRQRGAGKGLVRKLEEGIDLVHNKFTTTFLVVLADHMPLFFIRYKNKTTFAWCAVCWDHFVCGGGRSPSPCWLWWSSDTTNSVISSLSSQDFCDFIIGVRVRMVEEHCTIWGLELKGNNVQYRG